MTTAVSGPPTGRGPKAGVDKRGSQSGAKATMAPKASAELHLVKCTRPCLGDNSQLGPPMSNQANKFIAVLIHRDAFSAAGEFPEMFAVTSYIHRLVTNGTVPHIRFLRHCQCRPSL